MPLFKLLLLGLLWYPTLTKAFSSYVCGSAATTYVPLSSMVKFFTPNYPAAYGAGLNCSATYHAEEGAVFAARCSLNIPCPDRFTTSSTEKNDTTCGTLTVLRESSSSKVQLALEALSSSPGGYAFCRIAAIPKSSKAAQNRAVTATGRATTRKTTPGVTKKTTTRIIRTTRGAVRTTVRPNQICSCGYVDPKLTSDGVSPIQSGYVGVVSINTGNITACSGAVISATWILTSALCVYQVIDLPLIAKALFNGELRGISRAVTHERFDTSSLLHNLALLQLSSPFSISSPPLCLVHSGSDLIRMYRSLTARKEGARHPVGKGLSNATISVISIAHCRMESEYHSDFITDSMICASLPADESSCSYQITPGEPLSWLDAATNRAYLIGIASFPLGCNKPAVYTKVIDYIDWIASKSGLAFCSRPIAPSTKAPYSVTTRQPNPTCSCGAAETMSVTDAYEVYQNGQQGQVRITTSYGYTTFKGAILSPQWILTTASDAYWLAERNLTGYLRVHYRHQIRNISAIVVHEKFNGSLPVSKHNLALVKVAPSFTISARPLCLDYPYSTESNAGLLLSPSGSALLNYEQCKQFLAESTASDLPDDILCTTGSQSRQPHSFDIDMLSGDPLNWLDLATSRTYLIGVALISPCMCLNVTAYTNVNSYIDWIERKTGLAFCNP